MRLPPRAVRRVILAPLPIALTLLGLATVPVWLIAAAFVSRHVPGRWRALRLMWFGFVWVFFESIALVAMFGLWVASGFGWRVRAPAFQQAHYVTMAWFLRRVVGSARFTFGLRMESHVPPAPDGIRRPVIVLARHAGPGDSLLLVDALLNGSSRRPRVVLKDSLQWDPLIDVALNRLPSRFISTRRKPGEAAVAAIGELAASMEADDALVIFPEGGNFTPLRWERAIDKLRSMGLQEYAARAAEMKQLLPPKPAGVAAAVENLPSGTVVLVGHEGLEGMDDLADVWAGLRMDITVRTRAWRYDIADIPKDRRDLESWLYDRWADMNEWLEQLRTDSDGDVATTG